ncbi:MAG: hypothetical protein CMP12_09870 [Zunongwangia sp.]|uniref:Uncharacterized protein n=2 Tax=Zunongwangia profunda TaxID=398743 RepID=D5BC78_ZUNPS|nr:hypothetical protein [Zunongwangia profunda]MAG85916.1 hypothetical protein [Flavobacteriaceae bacterium]MAO36200.1 hypothetical protein [Zunongwangia sp.]ADF54704.1 hypothetical protein ZPR_4402 [Zunongwangia profunda SM-A87]MAS71098.1 hypothetical protein [Zunongwangia sp.]MBJ96710.1 hypothetical protein [Flavobacteriaceae bacterium]|tara:strand:+ start:1094 stop:1279 length:186 start_codon:yes stop_codon:yes gene_type:complete
MKNLESFGVQSLSTEHSKEINGGYSWLWQAAVATFAYNVVADWDANVEAFKEGMEAAKAAR